MEEKEYSSLKLHTVAVVEKPVNKLNIHINQLCSNVYEVVYLDILSAIDRIFFYALDVAL